MRRGLTISDLPPRGYHSHGYWAVSLVHDFYTSGDEVWELTRADLPDGSLMDKLRPALSNAMTRHGKGRVVARGERLYLVCENGSDDSSQDDALAIKPDGVIEAHVCICGGPERGSIHFDRSLCACGAMHYYCDDCGMQAEECAPASSPVEKTDGYKQARGVIRPAQNQESKP